MTIARLTAAIEDNTRELRRARTPKLVPIKKWRGNIVWYVSENGGLRQATAAEINAVMPSECD